MLSRESSSGQAPTPRGSAMKPRQDGGQCDEAVEEVLPRRVTPGIDEALLMSAAAPVKAKKKKKKRKKKLGCEALRV